MDFGWLKDAVGGIWNGLDELVTSDDERGQNDAKILDIRRAIFALEQAVQLAMIALEQKRMEITVQLAAVEVQSDAWYVKARRPILEICTFTVLTLDALGYLPKELPESYEYGGWILLGVNNALRGMGQVSKTVMGAKRG